MENRSVITGLIIILCAHQACSQECSSSLSFIRSPGYPAKYPKNLRCSWTIDTNDTNAVIAFNIDKLALELCSYCACDHVEIFDGSSAVASKSLGKWCKGSLRLLSTGQFMHILFHTDNTDHVASSMGFTSSHSIVSFDQVCPKTSDIIKANYSTYGNVNCAWVLDAYDGHVIVLEVSYLHVDPCSDCSCGYVEVFDGSSSSATKLGTWCTPPSFQISSGRYMYVRFVAKPDTTSHNFTAKYKRIRTNQVCTSFPSLKASTGTIKSSDYPSDYLKSVDCSWRIPVDPNYVVRLTVDTLDLGGCLNDCGSLTIYDGKTTSSPILGKWTLRKPDVISSATHMLITFKSKLVSGAKGFKATYHIISKKQICPDVSDSHGTLKSYGYPNTYPGNIRCSWVISASADYVIRFFTTSFDLHKCSVGQCDRLQIYDGVKANADVRLGTFDYAENDIDLSSTDNLLLIEFNTYTGGSRGFKGNYSVIRRSEVCPGSGKIYASSTENTIFSRNYPSHYWGNVNCSWHIEAPGEHVVRLTILAIDFQDCKLCACDYVAIYDGSSPTSKSYHKWCTDTPDLLSSGEHMFIVMRTSPRVSGRGFKAVYSSIPKSQVCPASGLRSGDSGTLQSPGYPLAYRGGLTCFWTIEAPFGKIIRFTSTVFNLQDCPSCDCDYVEIFDGSSHNSLSIGKWCRNGFDLVSTKRYLYIVFKSNADVKGEGFRASYSTLAESEVCPNSEDKKTMTGTLKSLGYPENYPGNLNCTWTISAPTNYVIRLAFDDFKLSQCSVTTPCEDCADYIRAYDVQSSSKVSLFEPSCGNNSPKDIFTTDTTLIVEMFSDSKLHNKGFQAKYSYVLKNLGCKGTGLLKNKTGQLNAPEDPKRPTADSFCIWKIQAPIGYTVLLSFDYVHHTTTTLCPAHPCSCSFIEVFNGSSSANTSSFGRICSKPKDSYLSGRFMYVTFWIDSRKGAGEKLSFLAKYTMIQNGTITARAHYVNADLQCLWILVFIVSSTWMDVF